MNDLDTKEDCENWLACAYEDMRGYIDNFYSTAKHHGVPTDTAS